MEETCTDQKFAVMYRNNKEDELDHFSLQETIDYYNDHNIDILKNTKIIYDAFTYGNYELIAWFKKNVPELEEYFKERQEYILQDIVLHCLLDELNKIKTILEIFPNFDISLKDDMIFRSIYRNNNIEIGKYLLDKYPNINISSKNDELFYRAYIHGNKTLTKWLLTIPNNTIKENYNKNKKIQEEELLDKTKYYDYSQIINKIPDSISEETDKLNQYVTEYKKIYEYIKTRKTIDIDFTKLEQY